MCWNRISDPGSKAAAFEAMDRYPKKCDFAPDDVCRFLDYLAVNAEALVGHMNGSLEAMRGPRDKTRFYHDVINYYFEIDGENSETLRKRGASSGTARRQAPEDALLLRTNSPLYKVCIDTHELLGTLPLEIGLTDDSAVVVAFKHVHGARRTAVGNLGHLAMPLHVAICR